MRRSPGVTVLEMLLIIAILGILMAITAPLLQPPAASLFANDLRIAIQQARHEAIRRNRPVAIVWNTADQSFTTRINQANPSLAAACTGPTVLNTRSAATYPRLSVTSEFGNGEGIVWLPNGQGRRCDGTALIAVSTQISDGRTTRTVTTNMTGMVTIE
jgi:Tfp pilus assembly protein FimT